MTCKCGGEFCFQCLSAWEDCPCKKESTLLMDCDDEGKCGCPPCPDCAVGHPCTDCDGIVEYGSGDYIAEQRKCPECKGKCQTCLRYGEDKCKESMCLYGHGDPECPG